MKKSLATVLLCAALLCIGMTAASAESLWSDNSNLFADRKARTVGDLVTIVISESTTGSRVGKSSNSKSASVDINAGTGILSPIASASHGASDSFTASGAQTNTNQLSGRMTAQVVEVKQNGYLVISGTQVIRQNKEEQKITIQGIIRPEDISADNSVRSSQIADSNIKVDGKGPITSKQRQGILTQLYNLIF